MVREMKTVIGVLVLLAALLTGRADEMRTLELKLRIAPSENPTVVAVAEYGAPFTNGGFRVMFNPCRDRSLAAYYGDARVATAPWAFDDGAWHHVAVTIAPGSRMTLFLDGVNVSETPVSAQPFCSGSLLLGGREEADRDPLRWRNSFQRLTGELGDVRLYAAPFDPATVRSGPPETQTACRSDLPAIAATWQRPKTTRRYLQGPLSERLLVYFREGKLVLGENLHRDDWKVEYGDLPAHGLWLIKGEPDAAFDFRVPRLSLSADAVPEHAQTWRDGLAEVSLSAVAPFGRRPNLSLRVTVSNPSVREHRGSYALLVRAAPEAKLVFSAPDIYSTYAPELSVWQALSASDWSVGPGEVRSGDRFVAWSAENGLTWDAARGALRFAVRLAPGETRAFDLVLGKGARETPDYAAVRSAAREDWQKELARLCLPDRATGGERVVLRHLAVQMLQCFAHPVGEDFVLPRQGGLQRYVWPWDAAEFFRGMDLLGFGDYVARACDYYFSRCQQPDGQFGPFRNKWAGDTACVLRSFASHGLASDDAEFWQRHREGALRAFRWIAGQREPDGLFPAMKSTDAGEVSRHWGFTDILNLSALEELAKAAARFDDPAAPEVAACAADYRAAIARRLDRVKAAQAESDELVIPTDADGRGEDTLFEAGFGYSHPGAFADLGFFSPDELVRVRRGLIRRGIANANGLYCNIYRFLPEYRDHTWYTTASEARWFRAWLRAGRADLARAALDACLKFALTDEYLVGERYGDASPWYYPWSPNASGAGRITQMIFDWCARR